MERGGTPVTTCILRRMNATPRAKDSHKNFSEISFIFYCMLQWSHQLNLESHILFLEEWFHSMP